MIKDMLMLSIDDNKNINSESLLKLHILHTSIKKVRVKPLLTKSSYINMLAATVDM